MRNSRAAISRVLRKCGGLGDLPRQRRVHLFIVIRQVFAIGGRKDGKEAAGKPALLHARHVQVAQAIALQEIGHRIAARLHPKTEQHIIVAIKNRNRIQDDYALAYISSTCSQFTRLSTKASRYFCRALR